MFAKLKKKIQDEGGISGSEAGEKSASGGDAFPATKSQNLSYIHNADYHPQRRTSTLSESEQPVKEKDVSTEKRVAANVNESFDAASKEELVELLMRRTMQAKTYEAKLSELTSSVKEKNQYINKLESELENQQDLHCQRQQDANEQYHSLRAKLSENIASAVKKREEEMKLEIQELEKAKLRLEERVTVVEMEKDQFMRKAEEREALERAGNEERMKLKNLLLQTQSEVNRYKSVMSEVSSDRVEKKDLIDKVTLLMQDKNEAERRIEAAEELNSLLRASNERLEKLLKESKDAYAQMALQNSQDDWLEKQIESERTITTLEEEISKLKTQLSQKERSCDSLQRQISTKEQEVVDFTSQIETLKADLQLKSLKMEEFEQLTERLNSQLTDALKDKDSFRQRSDELSRQCDLLHQNLSESKAGLESVVKDKTELINTLELQLSDHRTRLEVTLQQLSELQELKSVERQMFETEEMTRLKEELADVQLSLLDKNKVIKKQEQRLADLKKLLQRELKVAPSEPAATNGNAFTSGIDSVSVLNYDSTDAVPSFLTNSNAGTISLATLPISHNLTRNEVKNLRRMPGNSDIIQDAGILKGDSSGRNMEVVPRFNPQGMAASCDVEYDFTRELNFKYLRHVILKFMLSRETEAIQLIKAVSMLLNFTAEEQKLIKDTLEWKMSWFGSRPQLPMKGQTAKVVPPSL